MAVGFVLIGSIAGALTALIWALTGGSLLIALALYSVSGVAAVILCAACWAVRDRIDMRRNGAALRGIIPAE